MAADSTSWRVLDVVTKDDLAAIGAATTAVTRMPRPGDAGWNTVANHISVVHAPLAQVPVD